MHYSPPRVNENIKEPHKNLPFVKDSVGQKEGFTNLMKSGDDCILDGNTRTSAIDSKKGNTRGPKDPSILRQR